MFLREREMQDSPFRIFQPLHDLGYFRWSPKGEHVVGWDTITTTESNTKFMDAKGQPDTLVGLNELKYRLPLSLSDTLSSNNCVYKLPTAKMSSQVSMWRAPVEFQKRLILFLADPFSASWHCMT